MLSTEQVLLGSLGISEPGPAEQRSLTALLDQVIDTSNLVRLAQEERMACVLYRNLSVSGLLDRLEESQRNSLRKDYRSTAVLNLQLTHDIEELLSKTGKAGKIGEIGSRGVPIVLLKGVALLAEIYGAIGLRPMTDADLARRDQPLGEPIRRRRLDVTA
jgi:hypothetical protein